jgi:hypothetical protein
LDEKSKKAISNFLATDAGKEFFGSFANKGDKIGDYEFKENGKYSSHNYNFEEVSLYGYDEGKTLDPVVNLIQGPVQPGMKHLGYIDFFTRLNLNISDETDINFGETLGHEIFLHLNKYLGAFIEAFEKNGTKGSDAVLSDYYKNNYKGYSDHISMADKTKGSREYYEYINQLKKVFNPLEVQKHVNYERIKNRDAGKRQKAEADKQ